MDRNCYPLDRWREPAVSHSVVCEQARCEFVERDEGQVLATQDIQVLSSATDITVSTQLLPVCPVLDNFTPEIFFDYKLNRDIQSKGIKHKPEWQSPWGEKQRYIQNKPCHEF